MPKQIFVITTRRFNDVKSKKYPIADITQESSSNPCIKEVDSLASFWVKQLIEKLDNFKSKRVTDLEVLNLDDFFHNDIDKTVQFENLVVGDDIKYLKQDFVSYLLKEFNMKVTPFKFDENYLSYIHQLQHDDNDTLIFVYYHWLDKQGLENKERIGFLNKLRKSIQEILSWSKIDNFSINWLVHDTDILNSNYDGLLWFDGLYKDSSCKTSYHPTIKHEDLTNMIPFELLKDNIWCFVHQEELDSYFKNIILQFNSEQCQSADSLYRYLLLDKEAIIRRWGILSLFNIKANNVSKEDLAFLLNTPLDLVEDKIKMINYSEENAILVSNDLYNLSKLIS